VTRLRWNRREADRLLATVRGPVGRHLRAQAGVGRQAAQQLCPVSPEGSGDHKPGYLRKSIKDRSGRDEQGIYAEYGTDVDYALSVELGSKPHEIESKGDYPLRSKAGVVFGKKVQHPGAEAQPFLRPALEAIRDQ
jgi:hypothetical protein